MKPIDGEKVPSSESEHAVASARLDPEAVVTEYFYLLEGVPPIDETPRELNETVRTLLELLTGAHAMALFYALFCEQRPLRFTELEAATGASPKVLSRRLKEFVEAGLVTRRSYDQSPPHVEYEPTTMAKELDPAFQFLFAWAARHDQLTGGLPE
ncbi:MULTISPECIES: helix-turn-helix domain-containing protein [Haloferax]|uniref:MarR family transcriptional regulator n=2 Tax=Haloferax TaxID=2251 RepID=A0A6G1YYM1_9EURY|nr:MULTISPECIES: helix-turn-helix domain-containing protein [Haloferax]KAB1186534.1 helix-turn-helix transcriptional regulator [Haloferax sp. CBA1149]MRW79144.1 MarR family transcriptional regulator [Haloferax marinisediminis]